MVVLAAPTCPGCSCELELDGPGPWWWCWKDRTYWHLDDDGFLRGPFDRPT